VITLFPDSSEDPSRPSIPERPADDPYRDPDSDDDSRYKKRRKEEEDAEDEEYGFGPDGPQVVVLNEGKHLSLDQVEEEKKQAQADGRSFKPPPNEFKSSSSSRGSLSFASSSSGTKRTRNNEDEESSKDWGDVVKRAKTTDGKGKGKADDVVSKGPELKEGNETGKSSKKGDNSTGKGSEIPGKSGDTAVGKKAKKKPKPKHGALSFADEVE